MKKSKLPTAGSIKKLAEFWDTHDLTDFENQLVAVSNPFFTRGNINLRLDARDAKAEGNEHDGGRRRIGRPRGLRCEAGCGQAEVSHTGERGIPMRQLLKLAAATLAAFAVLALSAGDARADGRVITISEVTIVGRVQKPIASVDVNKIQPKLTLAELRQPLLERIEAATEKDPF